MSDEPRSPDAMVIAIGGGMLAVGSMLPWISATTGFGTLTRSGLDGGGDGVFTLLLGVAGVFLGLNLLGVVGVAHPKAPVGAIVAGSIALVILVLAYLDVQSRIDEAPSLVGASVGAGLYVSALGAGMVLFGGIREEQRSPSAETNVDAPAA